MEENEPVHENLEEALAAYASEGGGVFTNEAEQTKALRDNAEALGINPDLVAPEGEPQIKYYARKGCKHCFGRGVINVVISPSKRKVFWRNEREPTRISFRQTKAARSRHVGPTRPTTKKILLVSEGYPNEEGEVQWDTRRPEPRGYKENNMSQSFCRCIRAVAS